MTLAAIRAGDAARRRERRAHRPAGRHRRARRRRLAPQLHRPAPSRRTCRADLLARRRRRRAGAGHGTGGRRRGPPAARRRAVRRAAHARRRAARRAHRRRAGPRHRRRPPGARLGRRRRRAVAGAVGPARRPPGAARRHRDGPDPGVLRPAGRDGAHRSRSGSSSARATTTAGTPGSTATTSGAPTLVDGYANGWRITPPPGGGPLAVTLTWTPQRLVWLGLGVSAVAVVACLVLIVIDRRRVPDPLEPSEGRRPPPAALVVAGVTAGFALVAGPAGAVAAAATAALATWGPRRLRRWLPLLPAGLMAGVAAYVVAKTIRYPIPRRPQLAGRLQRRRSAGVGRHRHRRHARRSCRRGKRLVRPPNCVSGPVTR